MKPFGIDLSTVRFDAPQTLWLLILPAVFLILWAWQLASRLRDRRRVARTRLIPVRERFPLFGDLLFWLCVLLASASLTVALARPQAVASVVRTAGLDLIVLQDGSASM